MKALLPLLCLLASLSSAFATTISIQLQGSPSTTVSRTISDSTTGTQSPESLSVGLLAFSVLGAGTLYGYNLEPQQSLTPTSSFEAYDQGLLSQAPGNLGGLSSNRQSQLRLLFGQFTNPFNPASVTVLQSAAIQIAVWEIVRENSGSLNVAAGTTSFSNESNLGMLSLAQSYLNSVTAGLPTPSNDLSSLLNPTYNDLIVSTTGLAQVASAVPEPSTLLLSALAFSLTAIRFRRRS